LCRSSRRPAKVFDFQSQMGRRLSKTVGNPKCLCRSASQRHQSAHSENLPRGLPGSTRSWLRSDRSPGHTRGRDSDPGSQSESQSRPQGRVCPVGHESRSQLSADDPEDFDFGIDRATLAPPNPVPIMTARFMRCFVSIALATLFLEIAATNSLSIAAELPQVFILDSENLMKGKNRIQSNDS